MLAPFRRLTLRPSHLRSCLQHLRCSIKQIGVKRVIYLDYNATTPVDPEVQRVMEPFFNERFGNTLAVSSPYGWEAQEAVESCRRKIAGILACQPDELTFTSGATEANNWALRGLVDFIRTTEGPQTPIHILSSPVEHSSILSPLRFLQEIGVTVEFLEVTKEASIRLEDLKAKIRPETRLVCAVWVNSELGTLNPIREIAEICHHAQIPLLADATQALGKFPVSLAASPADLVSFSAHKLYGPKGVGLLFHRRHGRKVQLRPLLYGGGHEEGLRSGTLNVPGIVGMAKAMELADARLEENRQCWLRLQKELWDGLCSIDPGVRLNGPPLGQRSPTNLHVTFSSWTSQSVIPGLAISQGAACNSANIEMSAVLRALNFTDAEAQRSFRISMGKPTTQDDIQQAIRIVQKYVR
ncbi:MAG: cysteine desulfurase [Bdellovibrio sp.]|nr:MAG: cysteine desulfurase [Bdellovibrio sp.]